jgi:hypothetical protein
LAGFKAPLGFVDDINAPFAADYPAIAVAGFERFKRIANFHGCSRIYYLRILEDAFLKKDEGRC